MLSDKFKETPVKSIKIFNSRIIYEFNINLYAIYYTNENFRKRKWIAYLNNISYIQVGSKICTHNKLFS